MAKTKKPRLRHYAVSWTSPYLPNRRPQTLTMRATNKKEAEKLHSALFPANKRTVKAIP